MRSKSVFKAIAKVFVLLCTIVLTGLIALQTSTVQSLVTNRISEKILKEFDGRLTFSSIRLQPFSAVLIKDVMLVDDAPFCPDSLSRTDTVIRAATVFADFSVRGLLAPDGIHLRSLYIKGANCKLVQEPDGRLNIARIFSRENSDSSKTEFSASVSKANLSGLGISFKAMGEKPMDISGSANLKAKGVSLSIDGSDVRAAGTVTELNLREQSGLNIRKGSLKAKYAQGATVIKSLFLADGLSTIRVPSARLELSRNAEGGYTFDSESWFSAKVENSRIAAASGAPFKSELQTNPTVAVIHDLEVSGHLDDFKISELDFTEASSNIEGRLEAGLSGLGTGGEMLASLDIKALHFTTNGIEDLLQAWTGTRNRSIGRIAQGRPLTLSGKLNGPFNRLKGDIKLDAARYGSLTTNFDIRNILDNSRLSKIACTVNTNSLDLGTLLGNSKLEAYSLKADADITMGRTLESLVAHVSGTDPGVDLDLEVNGRHCKSGQDSISVEGVIRNLKLSAFVPKSMPLDALSMNINGEAAIGGSTYNGNFKASDVLLKGKNGSQNLGVIRFDVDRQASSCLAELKSSILNATFSGTDDPLVMISDLLDRTVKRDLPSLFSKEDLAKGGAGSNGYDLNITTGDMTNLLALFAPGLYISKGTAMDVNVTADGEVQGTATSDGLVFKGMFLRGVDMKLDNQAGKLSMYAGISEIGTQSISLKGNALSMEADSDNISANLDITGDETQANFNATAVLFRDTRGELCTRCNIGESYLSAPGAEWHLSPSTITLEPDIVEIQDLHAYSDDQSITLAGIVSSTQEGKLNMDLSNFSLSTFNPLLPAKCNLNGNANGSAVLTSPIGDTFGLVAQIQSTGTSMGDRYIGDVNLNSKMNDKGNGLLIHANNEYNGQTLLQADGEYLLNSKTAHIVAKADGLNVGVIEPFLTDVFSHMDGSLYGSVTLDGPLGKGLTVKSDTLEVRDAVLTVDYTYVTYNASLKGTLDNNGLHFHNIDITDRLGNKGYGYGGLTCDNLTNWGVDLTVGITNGEVINIPAHAPDRQFYGDIFGTAQARFTGPFNNVFMDLEATTAESDFHLPLNALQGTSSTDLLTFRKPVVEKDEKEEAFKAIVRSTAEASKPQVASNFGLRARINITTDAQADIELDESSGSGINGRGAGAIDIAVNTKPSTFNINGDYTLENGDFRFVALGVANRTFNVKKGSMIRFNGDVMQSDLDINASYTTKASISNLIADTTAVSTRRNVECGIHIGDKLANPSLSFDINVPDLDPTMKARVQSALNTDDKVQKQFIALLVTNGFIPDEESGIVYNSSNILYSNVAGIMANQLNNILQKFNIPVDLGLSYQSNTTGTDIFDVAVSTELFDNRVVVNGNIGNRDNTRTKTGTSTSTSDVVGDLDVEIKIDKEGEVRMNVFSHSADEYTNFLDNSQRNGVGITYQKEFSSIKEFFRGIFKRKKKGQEEQEELPPVEETVIDLDEPDEPASK